MKISRTRLAPTPSGFLHIGNMLSFLITLSRAKQFKAKVLLRIDDLDRERVKKKYVEDIFSTLDFLEIPWDEGPKDYMDFQKSYSQQHRLELYAKKLEELKSGNLLFACDCSRRKISLNNPKGFYTGFCKKRKLSLDQKEVSWRFATDIGKEVEIRDIFGQKKKAKVPASMRDFLVRKKDGLPSYQLASLVDDDHFGVDFVVRGRDLWESSIAQVYLSEKLKGSKFRNNIFLHHELITDATGKKMSKSAGSNSIQHLRKTGKKKEDIYGLIGNYLNLDYPVKSLEQFLEQYNAKDLQNPERA